MHGVGVWEAFHPARKEKRSRERGGGGGEEGGREREGEGRGERAEKKKKRKESERRESFLIRLSQSSCPGASGVGRIRRGERPLVVPGMCV